MITKSLIAGDRVYHYGDIITDSDAGLNLSLYCGSSLIELVEDEEERPNYSGLRLLRNLQQIFS